MKGSNNRQLPTTPKINDVVVIQENLPRGNWRVGRVIEVIKGKDHQIRSAKVMMAPKKYLNKAVNMLYPIECPGDDERTSDCDIRNKIIDSELGNDMENNEKPHTDLSLNDEQYADIPDDLSVPRKGKPTCIAANEARKELKLWLEPDDDIVLGSVAYHAR